MSLFANVFESLAPRGAGRVSGAEARRLVAEENAVLIDVRTAAEFGGGHAEGARNVPLQALARRLDELPVDRPVVVYCRSGGRSATAATLLRRHGYTVRDAGGLANVMS
ncbi:MAG TPA: rhodanese-like domain-containing protein [Sandaracinaceae bacterium LLY-WYZ-13_1]|nr:rhodanese-like domain-containing protein [Sandaracinaceae bacterium LLY-WYZ-13_1]